MQPSEYVTACEASRLCDIPLRTMTRWLATGRFPTARKVAVNRWEIPRASLPGHRPSQAERISELERRVEVLEARGRGPITRAHLYAPPVALSASPPSGADLPDTWWGRVEWVARVTGRSVHTVRSWPQLREWSSYADAVTWLREVKGISI